MFFNTTRRIKKFAKEQGYNGARYTGKWKEYKVYEPYIDKHRVAYIGLPLVILVNKQGEIRMSTADEATAIIDYEIYIKKFKFGKKISFSNKQDAIRAYKAIFGSFPSSLLGDLPDDVIIEKVKTAIKSNTEISIDTDNKTILSNNATQKLYDSKMVSAQLEAHFNYLMKSQDEVGDEYLSLPIINMDDSNNIKLQSSIISYYIEDFKKVYYCQGFIDKTYDSKTQPICNLFSKVEILNEKMNFLSSIPKGEYPNISNDELKEKYYKLLDSIKILINKDPDSFTDEDSILVFDYLKLYRYLEKERVQAYMYIKSSFLFWCIGFVDTKDTNSLSFMDSFMDEQDLNVKPKCPICNSDLLRMICGPHYCEKCKKYFQEGDGVLEEVEEPEFDENVFY